MGFHDSDSLSISIGRESTTPKLTMTFQVETSSDSAAKELKKIFRTYSQKDNSTKIDNSKTDQPVVQQNTPKKKTVVTKEKSVKSKTGDNKSETISSYDAMWWLTKGDKKKLVDSTHEIASLTNDPYDIMMWLAAGDKKKMDAVHKQKTAWKNRNNLQASNGMTFKEAEATYKALLRKYGGYGSSFKAIGAMPLGNDETGKPVYGNQRYKTDVNLIENSIRLHGTQEDLVAWQKAKAAYDELCQKIKETSGCDPKKMDDITMG